MNAKRITRHLKFLQLLWSGQRANVETLTGLFGISRRTVYRDISALNAAGLPVEFNPDRDTFCLATGFCATPANLTSAESQALVLLAFELGRNDRLPYFDAAQSAATKLEVGFPSNIRERLRQLRKRIQIRPSPVGTLDSKRKFYQQLVDAQLNGQVQRVHYDLGGTQGELVTKLRPYQLVFGRHCWHVIGRSSAHSRVEIFSLNRILRLDQLEECFSIPRYFRTEKFLRNAWQLFPEPGPDYRVVVRFTPKVARSVAEVEWHKTQKLKFEVDGSLVFRARVSGLSEIISWVMSYGDDAVVIRPEELQLQILKRAHRLVEAYEGRISPLRIRTNGSAKGRTSKLIPSGMEVADTSPAAVSP